MNYQDDNNLVIHLSKEIKEFKFENIKQNSIIAIFDNSIKDKSYFIKDIINLQKEKKEIYCFTSHLKNSFYKKFIKESNIYNGYKQDVFENIIENYGYYNQLNQNKILIIDNILLNKIESQTKLNELDNSYSDSELLHLQSYNIQNSTDYINECKTLRHILQNNRSYKIHTIIHSYNLLQMSVYLRAEIDYLFIKISTHYNLDSSTKSKIFSSRQNCKNYLYNKYCLVFPSFELFDKILTELNDLASASGSDNDCYLVIDNTINSNILEENIFFVKQSNLKI
jgi:hypothetical protein